MDQDDELIKFGGELNNFKSLLKNNFLDNEGVITLKSKINKNNIIIKVQDSGKGILKKDWKNIFRPGFSTKEQGWGLGLSLASRIIKEIHGGNIYVSKSQLGEGSIIEISLPKI